MVRFGAFESKSLLPGPLWRPFALNHRRPGEGASLNTREHFIYVVDDLLQWNNHDFQQLARCPRTRKVVVGQVCHDLFFQSSSAS
jgi:hypothetical protein